MDCGIAGKTFKSPSFAKPQFAADCDLKNIVNRFLKTGVAPNFVQKPTIESTENMPKSFEEANQIATETKQAFDALPLEERNKYNNDPVAWLLALEKAEQEEKAKQDKAEPAEPVEPVPEPTELKQ